MGQEIEQKPYESVHEELDLLSLPLFPPAATNTQLDRQRERESDEKRGRIEEENTIKDAESVKDEEEDTSLPMGMCTSADKRKGRRNSLQRQG